MLFQEIQSYYKMKKSIPFNPDIIIIIIPSSYLQSKTPLEDYIDYSC